MAFGKLTFQQSEKLKLDLFPSGQSRDIRVNDKQIIQSGYVDSWTDVFDLKSITPNSIEETDTERTVIKVHNDSVSISYDNITDVVWFDAALIIPAPKVFKGAIIELCAKSSDGVIIANISVARTDDTIRSESTTQFLQSLAGDKAELMKHSFTNQPTSKSLAFSTSDHSLDVYIHYTAKIFYKEPL